MTKNVNLLHKNDQKLLKQEQKALLIPIKRK